MQIIMRHLVGENIEVDSVDAYCITTENLFLDLASQWFVAKALAHVFWNLKCSERVDEWLRAFRTKGGRYSRSRCPVQQVVDLGPPIGPYVPEDLVPGNPVILGHS